MSTESLRAWLIKQIQSDIRSATAAAGYVVESTLLTLLQAHLRVARKTDEVLTLRLLAEPYSDRPGHRDEWSVPEHIGGEPS